MAIIERLSLALNVKQGEWSLLLTLTALLSLSAAVYELSDVIATAGFVSDVGPQSMPQLWIVTVTISLLVVGSYALIVDRMARVRLLKMLFGGFTLIYLFILALLWLNAPDWFAYPLLYITADLQMSLFPLAFWALANDLYGMSQTIRLFPVIGAGYIIGSVFGNALAVGSAVLLTRIGGDSSLLLAGAAGLLFLGLGLLVIQFRKRDVRARRAKESRISLRKSLAEALDFYQNVPLFRLLAISMLLIGFALTIIEYYFLFTIDRAASGNSLQFQAVYGSYNIIFTITAVLSQTFITGRLLGRAQLKNAFLGLPASIIAAAGIALAVPGLLGGLASRFVARLVERVWDEPARKALEGLIPDERRGNIGTFLDSHFYSIATLVGSAVLMVMFRAVALGMMSEYQSAVLYLAIAGAAGLGALTAALALRKVYDKSLLNWRLSRSRRKSVLDGIDF